MGEVPLYLRGVDIIALTKAYLQGQYVNVSTRPPVTIVPSTFQNEKIQSVVSKTTVNTKSHEFTNDSGYGSFVLVGYRIKEGCKYGECNPGSPANCMHCLRSVDPNTAMPIIVAKDSGSHIKEKYGYDVLYHGIDIFCHFSCVLAELRKRLCYGNHIYDHSILYLCEYYERATGLPFSELKPAPDNRLLKIFNGPMDYDEFHSGLKYSNKPENVYFLVCNQALEKDA